MNVVALLKGGDACWRRTRRLAKTSAPRLRSWTRMSTRSSPSTSIHHIPITQRSWRACAEKSESPLEHNLSHSPPCEDPLAEALDRPTGSSAVPTRQVVALVTTLLIVGIVLSVVTVFVVTNMGFKFSVIKVLRRFFRSSIARQVLAIIGLMVFVRSGLTPLIRGIREFLGIKSAWDNSVEYFLLKELYSPLEFLLVVAAMAALAESLLPPLISVPRGVIEMIVRAILALMFVAATARVVHNMKGRIFREAKWRMELEGKTTEQHRLDAVDKLLTVGIVIVATIMGLQSLGLDVNSVLAIGGVGGLAIGWAGREIFENLFSGLLLMGSRPFEVGDEVVLFSTEENKVEGIIVDVGWYRTIVRDFQREVYVIPNSLFSRSVVRNVTRKGREWRFFESLLIRPEDYEKAANIISEMRRIIRQDARVIQKLHKRAFLDGVDREFIRIYVSFYLEAPNRDAYMAARQQLFFDFVECILRNGAQIAQKKIVVESLGIEIPEQHLLGEALETMNMIDADADTIVTENDQGRNGFSGEMSSHVDASPVIKNTSPVDSKTSLPSVDVPSVIKTVTPDEDSSPVSGRKQDSRQPGGKK